MQIHVPTLAILCLALAPDSRAQTTCSGFEASVLLSSDLAQADRFGAATAMDGDVLVIGARTESLGIGAAYVFRWNGAAWAQEQKLVASNGAALQEFGQSVAVDGDVIVIGSPGHNCQEAVYVFRFDGLAWIEEQQLAPSAASFCNRFGLAVAVSGAEVVVGAEQDEIPGDNDDAGSVFVYRFDGAQWNEEQKLVSSNPVADDRFGHCVAVEGDRLVVGTPRRTFNPSAPTPGSVYAFRRTAGGWIEEQEISASDGFPSNGFGESLALDGDVLAVGSPASYEPGSAYVYTRMGLIWGNEQKVSASDGFESNEFANGIALDGARLVVGAQSDDAQGTQAGAAYLFVESAGAWSQALKLLTTDGENGNRLGGAVALRGDRLVLGSEHYNVIGSNSGAAFVYDLGALPACPVPYCTPKTASAGCIPTIGFLGSPSATSAGPFWILGSDILNRRPAMLVYGLSPADTPFMGGTLCVAPPVRRTTPVNSSGSPHPTHDCTGTLIFSMDHWIQNGFDPRLVAGVTVYAQYWFRDPLDAFGIGLTDALAFVINP